MGTIWFSCLVAGMIAAYVLLLDGFDLGAGAIHPVNGGKERLKNGAR